MFKSPVLLIFLVLAAANLPAATPVLERRAQARQLVQQGVEARPQLEQLAREDGDPLVRRTAWRGLFTLMTPEEALPILKAAYGDNSPLVRRAALEQASTRLKKTPSLAPFFSEVMEHEQDPELRRLALEATWPFHQEVRSLLQRPEYSDLALTPLEPTPLPREGWHFATDPNLKGHLQGWYKPEFDASQWVAIEIAQPWQAFGHRYEGVAWYRLEWTAPPEPKATGADLLFRAVDSKAWVWLNGHYLGSHEGWNQPFGVDVTGHLRWGKSNHLVVRVEKLSGTHAGIWKPVELQPYLLKGH